MNEIIIFWITIIHFFFLVQIIVVFANIFLLQLFFIQ
jgi:hypothetical protein